MQPRDPSGVRDDSSPLAVVFESRQLRSDIDTRIAEARELRRILQRRYRTVAAYGLAARATVERSVRARRRARSPSG